MLYLILSISPMYLHQKLSGKQSFSCRRSAQRRMHTANARTRDAIWRTLIMDGRELQGGRVDSPGASVSKLHATMVNNLHASALMKDFLCLILYISAKFFQREIRNISSLMVFRKSIKKIG